RVALHEFGHVLGLGHPYEHGQSVASIMNRASNTDDLQSDDIAGAAAIYGGTSTPTPSNRAPTVTASCSPCTVQTGRTATLTASATDPDGDALTYRWTAARGTLGNATAASTVWTAPDQIGAVTATITVQDGRSGSATASVTLQVVQRDTLQADARLLPGQSLTSGNSRFRLLYQADGNLVLYDDVARTTPWSSNTGGTSAGYTLLQGDGNLVVYDGQGVARWATGTPGSPNSRLVVQNDGNVVLYRSDGQPAWATGTSSTTPAPGSCTINTTAVGTTVQGAWTSSCSSTRRAAYAQYYRFTLSAQARVQIDLTSPTADAYLYLLRGSDQTGSLVAEDDDSAGGLNSRILATLTAGTYVIEATTYSAETGSFSVSLTTMP
ncbi:MAG: matrixin family metalloprotease, partial [Acidobacteria bacterium]|nr:matrixin family metalloprotease [Acidobacteriota bacterium]